MSLLIGVRISNDVTYNVAISSYDMNKGIEFVLYKYEKNSQNTAVDSTTNSTYSYDSYTCKIFSPMNPLFTHEQAPKKYVNYNPCDYYERIRLAFHFIAASQLQNFTLQQETKGKARADVNPAALNAKIFENVCLSYPSNIFSLNLNLSNSSNSSLPTFLPSAKISPSDFFPQQFHLQINESNSQIQFLLLEKADPKAKYIPMAKIIFNLSSSKTAHPSSPHFLDLQPLSSSSLYHTLIENIQLKNELVQANDLTSKLLSKSDQLRTDMLKKLVTKLNMEKDTIRQLMEKVSQLEEQNAALKASSLSSESKPSVYTSVNSSLDTVKKRGRKRKNTTEFDDLERELQEDDQALKKNKEDSAPKAFHSPNHSVEKAEAPLNLPNDSLEDDFSGVIAQMRPNNSVSNHGHKLEKLEELEKPDLSDEDSDLEFSNIMYKKKGYSSSALPTTTENPVEPTKTSTISQFSTNFDSDLDQQTTNSTLFHIKSASSVEDKTTSKAVSSLSHFSSDEDDDEDEFEQLQRRKRNLGSSTNNQVDQQKIQPASQPSSQPVSQPPSQPHSQPVASPIVQPDIQPIVQPATQPEASHDSRKASQPTPQASNDENDDDTDDEFASFMKNMNRRQPNKPSDQPKIAQEKINDSETLPKTQTHATEISSLAQTKPEISQVPISACSDDSSDDEYNKLMNRRSNKVISIAKPVNNTSTAPIPPTPTPKSSIKISKDSEDESDDGSDDEFSKLISNSKKKVQIDKAKTPPPPLRADTPPPPPIVHLTPKPVSSPPPITVQRAPSHSDSEDDDDDEDEFSALLNKRRNR